VTIDGDVTDAGVGTFALSQATVAENSGTLTIPVNRIGNATGSISFQYALSSDVGTVGEDVIDTSGQISWEDGENETQYITITLIDDELQEDSENFTLSLTPIDDSRLGSKPEITFTIADDDSNLAPVVTLGEDFQVNTSQMVTLTAEAVDSDNDEMTYLWELTSDGTVELSNAETLSATFTAPSSAQTLTFNFTATDFRGASTSESITVSVIAPTADNTTSTSRSSSGGSSYWLLLLLLPLSIRKIKHWIELK